MGIRVFLVDDHALMREGIKSLIAPHPDMSVIGEASDGISAVKLATELSPDIVLMDVSMPGLDGIAATRQILANSTHCKVLALSMNLILKIVRDILDAGASGYILKDCCFDEVLHAIRTVATSSGTYLSPPVADIFLKDYYKRIPTNKMSPLSSLTSKERQVLLLLVEGMQTKEIAYQLGFGPKTTEFYRRNILNKLEITNIVDLVKFAIREGISQA